MVLVVIMAAGRERCILKVFMVMNVVSLFVEVVVVVCGVPMLGVVVTVAVPGGGGGAEAAEDPSTAWRRPGAEAGAGRGT